MSVRARPPSPTGGKLPRPIRNLPANSRSCPGSQAWQSAQPSPGSPACQSSAHSKPKRPRPCREPRRGSASPARRQATPLSPEVGPCPQPATCPPWSPPATFRTLQRHTKYSQSAGNLQRSTCPPSCESSSSSQTLSSVTSEIGRQASLEQDGYSNAPEGIQHRGHSIFSKGWFHRLRHNADQGFGPRLSHDKGSLCT